MRIAFTIIFNGLHHLKHNNQANFILDNFDYWIVVEGAANSGGSTGWCNKMPVNYHNNGRSIDGTIEYLENLSMSYKNLIFIMTTGMWNSKDDMVNAAVAEVKKITNECFLWQIDVDEQWQSGQLINSEKELMENNGKTGLFRQYQYLGENLIAYGSETDWGGNSYIRRMWNWKGEFFATHEPPMLDGDNEKATNLTERFHHYSYYFEEDVKFKDKWYSGQEGCYDAWKKLKEVKEFPIPIQFMFKNLPKDKTMIYKI